MVAQFRLRFQHKTFDSRLHATTHSVITNARLILTREAVLRIITQTCSFNLFTASQERYQEARLWIQPKTCFSSVYKPYFLWCNCPLGPRSPHGWGFWVTIKQTNKVTLPWTSDQPFAEAATYTTNIDHHPCPQRDSNSRPQQPCGFRPPAFTARPLRTALIQLHIPITFSYIIHNLNTSHSRYHTWFI
jgi:hypothetical protein